MTVLSDRLRDILAVELQIDRARVHSGADLRSDLGMDSVAALNILFAAEEAFGIHSIEVGELARLATVADVEALVERHMTQAHAS